MCNFHLDLRWLKLAKVWYSKNALRLSLNQQARQTQNLSHQDRPWTPAGTPRCPMRQPVPASRRAGDTEPVFVVSVPCPVPVAIRRTEVPRFVVPGAATQHARSGGRSGSRNGSYKPSRKMVWRNRHVSACSACAIHAFTRCLISSQAIPRIQQSFCITRNRLRKRRTLSSGNLLPPSGSSTNPRNTASSLVAAINVFWE